MGYASFLHYKKEDFNTMEKLRIMGAEQIMVDHLKNKYSKVTLIYSNVSKNPDVAFNATIVTNYYFVLEAKKYNKSNRSNYPKQLLTEVLVNRYDYFKKKINNPKNLQVSFGILLAYENKKTDAVYTFLKAHINVQDWIHFGVNYDCKYVFLYDEANTNLYYQEWDTFLTNLNPTLYI